MGRFKCDNCGVYEMILTRGLCDDCVNKKEVSAEDDKYVGVVKMEKVSEIVHGLHDDGLIDGLLLFKILNPIIDTVKVIDRKDIE
ncbi:hypothetical protein [Bacillus wiedmannii]|uniref:hypothetical protein n=1 Tax=Bacillus wiedmannii TaxID=1890302 RepID=UPI00114584E8|nr:hypothetical protein [Bacillus wiedmannii]